MIPPDPRPDTQCPLCAVWASDQQFVLKHVGHGDQLGRAVGERDGKGVRGARGVIREIRSIDFVVDFNCRVGSTSAHEVEIPKRAFTNPGELEIGSVVEVSIQLAANHDLRRASPPKPWDGNPNLPRPQLKSMVENCMTPYYPAKGGLP